MIKLTPILVALLCVFPSMSFSETLTKYDGCSGGMSPAWRLFTDHNPPWEDCCDVHDQPYAIGGSAADRLLADRTLAQCVAARGYPAMATVMYWGVRVGGVRWLPTPWRWCFKKPFFECWRYQP
jgi:hypothetical protein